MPGVVVNTKRHRLSAPHTFKRILVLDLFQQHEDQMLQSLHCRTPSSKPMMSSITMSPTKPKGRSGKLNMGTTGTMEITEITGTTEITTRAGLIQTWVLA